MLWFRLEVDQITHKRVVMNFMDWVGSMGGVTRVLLKIIGFFFGGYAAFNSLYFTVASYYLIKSEDKRIFPDDDQGQNSGKKIVSKKYQKI